MALSDIERQFDKIAVQVRDLADEVSPADMERALHEGAKVLQSEMETQAPVRTGELADNIIRQTVQRNKSRVTVGVGPNKHAFHGVIVELHQDPARRRPFMRPAFDQKHREAIRTVISDLRDGTFGFLGAVHRG